MCEYWYEGLQMSKSSWGRGTREGGAGSGSYTQMQPIRPSQNVECWAVAADTRLVLMTH